MLSDREPLMPCRTVRSLAGIGLRTSASLLILLFALAVSRWAAADKVVADEQGASGSIRGSVRITEKLTEQRMRFRLYPGFKPAPPAPETQTRDDEYRNVVIYLRSEAPFAPAGETGARELNMAQQGETFIPHVLPIQVGSTVEFPNLDPIFHNVFSLSAPRTFDLGRYPQGESKSVTFDQAGLVPVFCHIHSDMSAVILVLDNPYFTVPEPDGRYLIGDVPPGSYTLVAWHERSKPVEHEVDVRAGQALELDLTVPIENEEPPRP